MSSLDLEPADLDKFAAHLRQLNKSELEVEMITVGDYRLRLKSTVVQGPRDQERVYKIVSIAWKNERPPGGALR